MANFFIETKQSEPRVKLFLIKPDNLNYVELCAEYEDPKNQTIEQILLLRILGTGEIIRYPLTSKQMNNMQFKKALNLNDNSNLWLLPITTDGAKVIYGK